jgi:hypothetical protein
VDFFTRRIGYVEVKNTWIDQEIKEKEQQKALEDIKDDEVQRELAKGNTLISYIEYQSQ